MSVTTAQSWESLPPELSPVRNAIERSRDMLRLGENWDTEGGVQISEATWFRAVGFLMRQAGRLWNQQRKVMDAPDITPVPDGSIDIHWDYPSYELLVNIPSDENAMAGFLW